MKATMQRSLGLALISLAGVDAFFRINCATVQSGRIDPLVNPGALAAHSHTIVGGSNIGVNATYQSLLNSDCSSCEIQADKSAYWSPTLYYNYENGTFVEVPHGGAVVYYLGRGPGMNDTVPFPPGFMILSGDKSARSFDNTTYTFGNATYPGRPVADRVTFLCIDEKALPEQHYMYDFNCAGGMRAQIHFQSCWNGKDLYKADNSHVAYQSQIDDGICPPTHPIQIPHIFMEINYGVIDVPNQTPKGQFVFSQGDTTGYGFHADFQNGWEMDIQEYAVKNCLNTVDFGQISACPPLYAVDTSGYGYNCPQRPRPIGEQVDGLLDKLPGCITITNGPAAAPAAAMNCPAGVPLASITKTVDTQPTPTRQVAIDAVYPEQSFQKYLGCWNDTYGYPRTLNSYAFTDYANMTVGYCQKTCNQRGYRYSGVEFSMECHCSNTILETSVEASPLDSTFCSWNCGGQMVHPMGYREICGGLGYMSIYNNTDPSFIAFGSDEPGGDNSGAVTPPAPLASNYVGCYTDTGERTLGLANTASNNMTIEACLDFCNAQGGSKYYGLEYASQCFCGNTLAASARLLNSTTTPKSSICSMRCSGNNPEVCGGPNALSVYINNEFKLPAAKPSIGKYQNKQCLTDPKPGARSLTGPSKVDSMMTNEMCVKFCLGQQMHYAGIEYATECYCANDINPASGGTIGACPASALMLCGGDKKEYCGGPSLMTLFYSETL